MWSVADACEAVIPRLNCGRRLRPPLSRATLSDVIPRAEISKVNVAAGLLRYGPFTRSWAKRDSVDWGTECTASGVTTGPADPATRGLEVPPPGVDRQTKLLMYYNKKHLKNVGPIRHCEPPHAALPFTRCRYCRTPPAHRCPQQQRRRRQRQRVTEWAQLSVELVNSAVDQDLDENIDTN